MSLDAQAMNLAIIEQLQTAAASGGHAKSAPDVAAAAVEDYDWDRPHRFTPAALERLSALAEEAAERVAGALGRMLARDLSLAAGTRGERYGGPAEPDAAPAYRVALVSGGTPVGTLFLPAGTAVRWVEQLLGAETDAEDEPRRLSEMETALLLDVAGAAAEGLSSTLQEFGGPALEVGDEVVPPDAKANPPLPAETPGEELWQLDLSVAPPEEASDAEADDAATNSGSEPPAVAGATAITVAFCSDALEPLVGTSQDGPEATAPDKRREAVLEHFRRAPVEATVHLGTAGVRVRDLVLLGEGDVVVLDTGANDPLSLSVDAAGVLRGTPVTCEGRYGLRVCEFRRHPRLDADVGATAVKKGTH
jgi:flagellar motor switch protein FliM